MPTTATPTASSATAPIRLGPVAARQNTENIGNASSPQHLLEGPPHVRHSQTAAQTCIIRLHHSTPTLKHSHRSKHQRRYLSWLNCWAPCRDPLGPPCKPWPTPSTAGRLHPYVTGPATSCCSGSLECQHQSRPIAAVLNTSKLLSKALHDIEAGHHK
ncbi:uncharacterized protein LOC142818087 isoform X2 [Rhipicephalus microplus]|uniref:uncharacterized protein LOC142818087 isoform X2 n=1 Tax=Rhipicephalus microplus TaxID=6941 RepID=UPI003F6D6EBA